MRITESKLRRIIRQAIREQNEESVRSNITNESILRSIIRQELIKEGQKLDAIKKWAQRAAIVGGIAGSMIGMPMKGADAKSVEPDQMEQQLEDQLPGQIDFGSIKLSTKEVKKIVDECWKIYGEQDNAAMTEKENFEMNVYAHLKNKGLGEDEAFDLSNILAEAFYPEESGYKGSDKQAYLAVFKLVNMDAKAAFGASFGETGI